MTPPACYAFNFLHLGLFEDVPIYLISKQPKGKQAAARLHTRRLRSLARRGKIHFPLFIIQVTTFLTQLHIPSSVIL